MGVRGGSFVGLREGCEDVRLRRRCEDEDGLGVESPPEPVLSLSLSPSLLDVGDKPSKFDTDLCFISNAEEVEAEKAEEDEGFVPSDVEGLPEEECFFPPLENRRNPEEEDFSL